MNGSKFQLLEQSMASPHSRPPFQSQPLRGPKAIRLIALHPGARDDPISCNIIHEEYDTTIFEALSYEWRQPGPSEPQIIVDGHPVRIRQNLHDALVHIRSPGEEWYWVRHIWIDALCINQADLEERSQQVQIMSLIYSSAANVVSWLGLAGEGSDEAMDMLARLDALPSETLNRIDNSEPDPNDEQLVFDFKKSLRCAEDPVEALIAMCNRPYWRRVWVKQEIHLAKRFVMHCGEHTTSSLTLERFRYMIYGNWDMVDDPVRAGLSRLKNSIAIGHIMTRLLPPSILTLSRVFVDCFRGNYEASEPRDYVYALIGIASDCEGGVIRCDYKKPILEVYLDAVAVLWKDANASQSKKTRVERADKLAIVLGIEVTDNLRRLRGDVD
jgi:hypothetical protein